MKNLNIYILSFLSFVFYSGIAQENIDENLLEELKAKQSEEFVSVIVMLKDQADIVELKRSQEKLSRQEIHMQVVTTLQDKAKVTQSDLLSYLSMHQRQGNVEAYKPLWIVNAVIVKVKSKTVFEISKHKDVSFIYLDYIITSIIPVEQTRGLSTSITGVEDGITLINADCLWAQGYTGNGRIVSHLDTGVDASHPALSSKWLGTVPGITAAESWFDPNGLSPSFPVDSGSHGTHTMGTILGSTPGDIIGVAYDAKWISAGVIDIGGISGTVTNALLALQWTADPDGNPFTVSDVPDVSSNSWGLSPIYGHVPSACDTTFWSAIDNLEAATVVVLFAAGNEGGFGASTLRTPSDRATTFNNAFSVGALDATGSNIASYSSRGPSTCATGTMSIKPEVVARGSAVRSSIPGGGYANFNGTSMATPHVAGAVALLREVNPNATVDQIKDALILSSIDLGTAGEDNNYGHGLIDVCAAALLISPCPAVLNITANVPSGTDTQEASNSITASNTISSGATAIYHAGDEVLLTSDFDALNGSVFRAYIEGCTNNFVSRQAPATTAIFEDSNTPIFEEETTTNKMYVAPNPNNGIFTLYFDQKENGVLQVYDFKGTLVLEKAFESNTSLPVSIQRNIKGMYFVKVITQNQTYTEKVIKE